LRLGDGMYWGEISHLPVYLKECPKLLLTGLFLSFLSECQPKPRSWLYHRFDPISSSSVIQDRDIDASVLLELYLFFTGARNTACIYRKGHKGIQVKAHPLRARGHGPGVFPSCLRFPSAFKPKRYSEDAPKHIWRRDPATPPCLSHAIPMG
jgi:hypothetical protein